MKVRHTQCVTYLNLCSQRTSSHTHSFQILLNVDILLFMRVVYVLLVYILFKALMLFSGQLFRLVWIFVPQRCQSFQMVLSFNLFIILTRGIPSLRAELALTIPFSYLNTELWLKYTPGVRAIELCIPCSQDWLLVLIHQLHLQCLTSWYLFTAARQGGRIAAQKKVVSAVFGA